MNRLTLSLFAVALFQLSFAQFTPAGKTLYDNLNTIDQSVDYKLGKKAAGSNKSCNGDTLDYARYKASSLVGINISNGYQLGQMFDAPGEVTISGFDFYAWQSMRTKAVVEVYCQLFDAGADSLPSGAPVRQDTLYVDSTFGGGVLTILRKRAVFKTPYVTSKPYIIVVSTNDTNRVAVVTNSYTNGDGNGEDLACGTVGGRWYKASNLNIGGTTLDCDIALEPHVSYKVFNDFKFKDCYNFTDTVKFSNESSPFYRNQMYNRYVFFGLEQYCHRWDYYGTGGNSYVVEGIVKYTTANNYRVRLISTQYQYRGGGTCIDTTYKDLSFQPMDITFSGDKNICSGNYGFLDAITNGNVNWYRSPTDTIPFRIGKSYSSANTLDKNDTLFAKAVNKSCISKLKQYIIEVTTTPELPTVQHDSICLNSLANLVASTNAGIIRWFADSITPFPLYSGDVFQVGPLNKDTFFYVQAFNGACTHAGRTKAYAYVSSAFAPQAPTISSDTTICLLTPSFERYASSSFTNRWYNKAAGGSVLHAGDTFTFTPSARGDFKLYVDAYDGNCASSRLPISIRVNHFPVLNGLKDLTGCAGDSLKFDLSSLPGSIDWFDAPTEGNTVFSGKIRDFNSISATQLFHLEPYEGMCRDSIRHQFKMESVPYGQVIDQQLDPTACDGQIPTLRIVSDLGKTLWYNSDGTTLLLEGTSLKLPAIAKNEKIQYAIDHRGCVTQKVPHQIKWLFMPDANYDYQVAWKNVDLASRLIGQGTYVWTFGDGSDTAMGTDVKHFYAEDGDYDISLVVTSPDACSDTVTKTISINTVGIDELDKYHVLVFPNPVSPHGVITVKSEISWLSYKIVDLNGRLIQGQAITNTDNTLQIEVGPLPNGLYYLHLNGALGNRVVGVSVMAR